MPSKFHPGDTAYILESNFRIREVTVLRVDHGFILIQIKGDEGCINLREGRVFATKEEVIASAKR